LILIFILFNSNNTNIEKIKMDYIFYYHGDIPNHVFDCFRSIRKVEPNSQITLCTNNKKNIEKFKNLNIFTSELAESEQTKTIRELTNRSDHSLWLSSLLRIFYNLNVAKLMKVNNFVHFDTDVVVFKSFEEIKENFNHEKFNITPLNNQLLVFGYSYVGNLEIYEKVCDLVFDIVLNQKYYEKEFLKNQKFNEMAALNIAYRLKPELFNLLQILPNEHSKVVFDPASYGQYISGVHKKLFSKGYATNNHFVGEQILNNNLKPYFNSKKAYVVFNEKKVDLVNLHIHKKNLKKFI